MCEGWRGWAGALAGCKICSLTPEADDFDTPAGERVYVAFLFRDGQRVQEVQVAAGPRSGVALVNGWRIGCGDKDPGKRGREDGSDEHDGVRPSACDRNRWVRGRWGLRGKITRCELAN